MSDNTNCCIRLCFELLVRINNQLFFISLFYIKYVLRREKKTNINYYYCVIL